MHTSKIYFEQPEVFSRYGARRPTTARPRPARQGLGTLAAVPTQVPQGTQDTRAGI